MTPDEAYIYMEEIIAFLNNYSDVNDGPDGSPVPNKAMRLLQKAGEILVWLEKLP